LVIGANQYDVSVSFSTPAGAPATVAGGTPPTRILDAQGQDVTAHISQGKLAGLLDMYNNVLPSVGGNAYQQGDLNLLAQSVADRVNQILTSGDISSGPPPVPGIPLFTYNAATPSGIAGTLNVNNAMTPDQLAAIDPGPPLVSNGIALRLAALASPTSAADEINGYSYAEFYGNMASVVGRQSQDAQSQLAVQQQTVAQARNLRSQASGVDLNADAVSCPAANCGSGAQSTQPGLRRGSKCRSRQDGRVPAGLQRHFENGLDPGRVDADHHQHAPDAMRKVSQNDDTQR